MSERSASPLARIRPRPESGSEVQMGQGKSWLVVVGLCMFLILGALAFALVGIAFGIMWGAAVFATLVFGPCAAFILWSRSTGPAPSSHETFPDTHA